MKNITNVTNNKDMKQYIEWDVPTWRKALELWDKHLPTDLTNINILEVGARGGGLTLYYAQKGANCTYSDTIIHESARELFRQNNLEDKIKMISLDLTNTPKDFSQFDIIISKSVLGGIKGHLGNDAYQKAHANIYSFLKPGGFFFFVENSMATPIHFILRKKLTKWGKRWHYFTPPELNRELSPLTIIESRSYGFLGLAGRLKFVGHMFYFADNVLNKIIPDKFKYVYYGVAKKT